MRERLIIAFVGLTVGILVVFSVVRAYDVADLVRSQDQRTAERLASVAATLVTEQIDDGEPIDQALLQTLPAMGDSVTFTPSDGAPVVAGNQNPDPDATSVSQQVPGGSITVTVSAAGSSERLSDELLRFVLLVLGLSVLATIVGVALAARLTKPFRELAQATEQFSGRGPAPVLPAYPVPEAERLRLALYGAVRRIESYIEHERDVAVQASHELRTPIAALRLSLEDLALWKQTHPDVAEELQRSVGELDRLNTAVDQLLDRSPGDAADADLVALARLGADRHRASALVGDRSIEVRADGEVVARLDPDSVLDVLDIVLADAAEHGFGDVIVTVSAEGPVLRVVVGDESERRLPTGPLHRDAGPDAGPLGRAAQAAEALGGYLLIEDDPQHRVALVLPAP